MAIATSWSIRTHGIGVTFHRDEVNVCWSRPSTRNPAHVVEMSHNDVGWYWVIVDTASAGLRVDVTIGRYHDTRVECARDIAQCIVDGEVIEACWTHDSAEYRA